MGLTELRDQTLSLIWTKAYIMPVFILSFFIPRLKKVITDYAESGNNKSIKVISLISGFFLTLFFFIVFDQIAKENMNIFYYLLIYVASIGNGYFWLLIHADKVKKNKI